MKLLWLIQNDLFKISKQKKFIYLLISIILSLLLSWLILSKKYVLLQFSKAANESNLFTSFYVGKYLFVCSIGLIGLNLALVFLYQLEKKNNTWKYLLTLPVPYHFHIMSKLFSSFVINLIVVMAIFLIAALEALILPLSVNSTEYMSALLVLLCFMCKFFLLSLSASAFHLMLHFFSSNQALLILISVIMPIACLFDFLSFLPYGWPNENFWLSIKVKYNHGIWGPIVGEYEKLSMLVVLVTITLVYYLRHTIFVYSKFYK
ncbi:MAG: ABC transporter permease [Chryseotalea sp. WA131a]|jgi:ABC-type transport system involved in multi-copper enzyme maturation permease subunit|nr:MAG: ABC transporter permease [Chryseotalea sp. WA131a]